MAPTQPATCKKKAVTKGKVVQQRVSWPRARKVMRIESPPPEVIEDHPVAASSGVGLRPLFAGTPGPSEEVSGVVQSLPQAVFGE